MKKHLVLLVIGGLLSGCANIALTPSHEIPVRNDFVAAGIQPGDTVELTMENGDVLNFEVVDVRFNVIEGPDGVVELAEIARIVKFSWTEPGHPCGANEPVGCSIPEVVLLLSDDYSEQAAKFHPACVTHDYCYRHGHATYGETRADCDNAFLEDMKETCGGLGGLNILDLTNYSICNTAAQQTYNAVQLKGAPHFRTTTSSICEYKYGNP